MCEMVNRRITRMEADGGYTPIAETSGGKRLNRPNDVVGRSDGSLYFTNPGRDRLDPADVDMQFNSVNRITPDGEVELVAPFEYPNGIAFSPDERTLYVSNTRPGQYIVAYDLDADGAVAGVRHFADMPSPDDGNGVPDGIEGGHRGARVLHRPRRLLGIRAGRGADRRDRAAGVPRELRLGRRRQPHAVFHGEYVGVQPADGDAGDGGGGSGVVGGTPIAADYSESAAIFITQSYAEIRDEGSQ